MIRKSMIISLAVFIITSCNPLFGQTNPNSPVNKETTFELKNDTLVSNTGLKLFVGQKLIIGSAAGNEGQYRSIISGKAALVPSIWGQDKRFENAIENYVDSKKNKKKLKDSLIRGNVLTITGIGLSKTGRPHFYMVLLSSGSGAYKGDIKLALMLGELLLQP